MCCYHRRTRRKSGPKWELTISSLLLLICRISHVLAMRKGKLMSPSSFIALSGDLHVQIQFSSDAELDNVHYHQQQNRLHPPSPVDTINSTTPRSDITTTTTTTLVISKFISESSKTLLQPQSREIIKNITLYPDPRNNITQIAVPCQTFYRGGLYELAVFTTTTSTTTSTTIMTTNATALPRNVNATLTDERLRQQLDVRWPTAQMVVNPTRLMTYPEMPVEVVLRFSDVDCDDAAALKDLPEFWLELIYCGKDIHCADAAAVAAASDVITGGISKNSSKNSNLLYAEEIRGFPRVKTIKLRCELFGLAGNYLVQLRPIAPTPASAVSATRSIIKVDWSDKFVFNVYARSIFPCDPHTGIGVLYEYPGCILEQGDRVRVYAKLRADVASLKPPTSLHYVAEQRVVKSQYSLYFNCELFSEKYVEYCFVYVSQGISGAVADVRMDCVPTLPVKESDTGGWGPWSEWTACSTNCLGGTRNRYRFCDSPPPRYGAKFCEGPSVETEKCGKSIADTWDCIYESSGKHASNVNRTEVIQEIGPGCRCGCIVHLGSSKPKRIIAGATQSCPGRSFWLIQVDGDDNIALGFKFLRLPCTTQYIKVRDGPSLSSTLLTELNGGNNANVPIRLESSGGHILVEFYAGDVGGGSNVEDNAAGVNNAACTGGFLSNIEQLLAQNSTATPITTRLSVKSRAVIQKSPKYRTRFTIVHLSAVVFAIIIILISALLGFQYIVRYRKYHLAISRRHESGSRLHTPRTSMGSLQTPPSRAVSTTTLLSEVIYLVKMRPKHQLRHSILRESVDAEVLARETEFNDGAHAEHMLKCDEEMGSNSSIVTLRNEVATLPIGGRGSGGEEDADVNADADSEQLTTATNTAATASVGETFTRKDSAKDSESIISDLSSACNSPPMMLAKSSSKYFERDDAVTLMRNARLDDSLDSESLRSLRSVKDSDRISQLDARSISLTNGCYSPAASIISTATIRTTNQKESKDKQNRKKLLARPGSEFSLTNPEELELDYYDYNVINAGAAPGSYLGMDPAYLVWIPPMDGIVEADSADRDDDKTPEPESLGEEPLYEEILPKYKTYLSPGSNTETLSSDEVSPLNSSIPSKASSPSEINLKNCLIQKSIAASHSHQSRSTLSLIEKESIQMSEMTSSRQQRPQSDEKCDTAGEKETAVVKSPSDLQDFYGLDDIRFADEESDHDQSTKGTLQSTTAMSAVSLMTSSKVNYLKSLIGIGSATKKTEQLQS